MSGIQVSRSSVVLTKDEVACKRQLFASTNMPRFREETRTEPIIVDQLRGIELRAQGIDSVRGELYSCISGELLVPAQPTRFHFKIENTEEVDHNLMLHSTPSWSDETIDFRGPFMLHESFVVTLWFNSLYGGWNITCQKAINAWSHYNLSGEANVSQGQQLDDALAQTGFVNSDCLIESGLLDEGIIYYLEVCTNGAGKIAAINPSGMDSVKVICARKATANESGDHEIVPLSQLELCNQKNPYYLLTPKLVPGISQYQLIDRKAIVRDVCNLKPPFNTGAGIGVLFINSSNGDRAEFVNPLYFQLYHAIVDQGLSLSKIFVSSENDVIVNTLKLVYPEKIQALTENAKKSDLLVEWVMAQCTNDSDAKKKFEGFVPSSDMINMCKSFSKMNNLTRQAVVRDLKRVAKLSKMVKKISYFCDKIKKN